MNRSLSLTVALLSFALPFASAPAQANVAPRPVSRVATSVALPPSADGVVTAQALSVPGFASPDTTPKVIGTYISTVLAISGTPCFDCVHGSTKGTFGEGYPLGYVNLNTEFIGVLLEWFDVSYTGSCKITITLTLGGKTLKAASGTTSPTPGGAQNSLMDVTRSSAWHGAAAMTGKTVCGTTTTTNKGTVYFQ